MAELRVNDFSGGETDRFRDGSPNAAQVMRNLYISENKRLISRPGYSSLYSDIDPFGLQAIQVLWTHDSTIAIGGGSGTPEYQTFAYSNGAIQVSNDRDGGWRTVTQQNGSTSYPIGLGIDAQSTYTRINENEFIILQHSTSGANKWALKFFKPKNSEWKYVSLGLPKYANTVNTSKSGAGTGNDWVYALVLKHTYTMKSGSQDVIKIVRSEPQFSDVEVDVDEVDVVIPNLGSVTMDDNIGDSVDAAYGTLVVWEIYRTVDSGTIFYKLPGGLGEEPTSGGILTDNTLDTALVAGEILYTNSGAAGNGMANSEAIMSTFANDALWLASEERVWQSKVGIYDAFPGSFNFTVSTGSITAINNIDVYPILFTKNGVYRVEGIVDDLGNGTHRVRTISENSGALSNKTTVKAKNKIFYWSDDGIYMTNGYTAKKVTGSYNDTYQEIISRVTGLGGGPLAPKIATGTWDKVNNRLHWFFPESGGVVNIDTLTLDLKYPSKEGYPITSGDVPYGVFSADSNLGNLHIGTSEGLVCGQLPSNTYDVAETTSGTDKPINWEYISCSLSFGSSLIRKFFSRLLLDFTNRSDLTIRIHSDTDESDDYREHNPIRERGFTRGLYFLKRWFPKGRLRGTYKTIRLSNDAQILSRSDDSFAADCSGASAVITSGNWPADTEVGFFLSLASDGYTAQHEITTFSGGDTLIVSPNLPTVNGVGWQIKGIPKAEAIELNGYTVSYSVPQEGHTQSATVVQGND